MKASDFDKKFDEGKDVTTYLDLRKAKRAGRALKRVNVDFPIWMVRQMDKEAHRLGVTRQSLIKLWLADKLQHTHT
ncbi:MAG: CopG family transcriptional regulator [Nitrospinae bacterium]|nr:CopG family transcriptional regulator [Nitrospinota bacterium]